jgi:hypothetical protein
MTETTGTLVKDVSARDLRYIAEGFAKLAVKVQFAMNGGASAAMITFIGTGVADGYLRSAVYSLAFFAAGVLLAASVSALSFFAARRFYEAKKHANDPVRNKHEQNRARQIYKVSSVCVWLSIAVFALGMCILCYSILPVDSVTAGLDSSESAGISDFAI